jgi:hypothetical protein
MIIWEVKRKMGIRLERIIGTLKFRVPEYNFIFSPLLSLLHGEMVTIRTEYFETFQRLGLNICPDVWEEFVSPSAGWKANAAPPSCSCTLKGSGSFFRDMGA